MTITATEIEARLRSYPGAHENEKWKLEKDLSKCSPKETAEIYNSGLSPEYLMEMGLNRGEVHHILFGYKFQKRGFHDTERRF